MGTPADDRTDSRFMQRALTLAEQGWGRVSPNPLVGAVVVQGGEIIGEGWHAEYGAPHAEVNALAAAGERAKGATLYVSLEPCSHFGKTPPCTDAITAAGVSRVVIAAADPNPLAQGGADRLRERGIQVAIGVEEAAARDLNGPFFHSFAAAGTERPWVQLKLALSLDARVADSLGDSKWITGEAARAEVHRMRAGSDAIAVGVGTVLADDPLLTVRDGVPPRRVPVRVVFDRQLRTPVHSRLAQSARSIPLWIIAAPDAPAARKTSLESLGAQILPGATLEEGLAALRAAGIASLFCEGGAEFASTLAAQGLVDRLELFYAPLFLGPAARSPFASLGSPAIAEAKRWRRIRTVCFGSDTLITLAR